jgi:hypothetical protein
VPASAAQEISTHADVLSMNEGYFVSLLERMTRGEWWAGQRPGMAALSTACMLHASRAASVGAEPCCWMAAAQT